MAVTTVPNPVLDTQDGDSITAQAIGSLPTALSDRSDSNPAIALLEAAGFQVDKLLAQINLWPKAVLQKLAALVGITLNTATAAQATQTFTLSTPQAGDTVIPIGTQIATADGSIIFSTLADLTITKYDNTLAGTITITSGSATVTGSGTAFVTGSTWVGRQITVAGSGTWYTIASVASTTSLTLTSSATSSASGAYYVGPITGTVNAQCTTTGLSTNVAANALTSLQSAIPGVGSTTNAAAASGGTDDETTSAFVARAPDAFVSRDVACSESDYQIFTQRVLGKNSRAKAKANYNGTTPQQGYITVAALSPNWVIGSAVTASELSSVTRDLQSRGFTGATLVPIGATIDNSIDGKIAFAVYRRSNYSNLTAATDISGAVNTYLSPNTYDWGRTIYLSDMVGLAEALNSVDRVHTINGVPAIGFDWAQSSGNFTFTNGSSTVTAASGSDTTSGKQNFLYDGTNNAIYLVTAGAGTTSLTIDRAFTGPTVTALFFHYTAADYALGSIYTLPYTAMSTTTQPASIIVLGSA